MEVGGFDPNEKVGSGGAVLVDPKLKILDGAAAAVGVTLEDEVEADPKEKGWNAGVSAGAEVEGSGIFGFLGY